MKKLRVREVRKLPEVMQVVRGRDCILIKAAGPRVHLLKFGLYTKASSNSETVTWGPLVSQCLEVSFILLEQVC